MKSEIVARALELLGDADAHISVRIGIIGTLAMALVADVLREDEKDEAREIVIAFWRGLEVGR